MGTKNNPSSFDCYANAEPDEEMFILLARDWRAPALVELWAVVYSQDKRAFDVAVRSLKVGMNLDKKLSNDAKTREARTVAMAMRNWLRKKRDDQ